MELASSSKTDDELVAAFKEKSKRKDLEFIPALKETEGASLLGGAPLRRFSRKFGGPLGYGYLGEQTWQGVSQREESMVSLLDAIRKGLGMQKKSDMEVGEELVETRGIVGSAEDYQLGPDDGVRISPMPLTAEADCRLLLGVACPIRCERGVSPLRRRSRRVAQRTGHPDGEGPAGSVERTTDGR